MKKLIIINLLIILMIPLLFIQPLKADLLIDISGIYIDLGDEGSVKGGGLAFLWDMPRYFDNEKVFFYINSTFAFNIEEKDKPLETVRTYIPVSAGFEYKEQIFQIPLYLTGSAGAGVSYFKKEGPAYSGSSPDPSQTQIDSAYGFYAEYILGLNYVVSQNVAFFVRGGYQLSFYNEDNIESPKGVQFTAGLRIPISGSNRSLE